MDLTSAAVWEETFAACGWLKIYVDQDDTDP
ncbi:hypothetical protein O77CONTIG1_01200 [Leptolyngbya sp. O-77]|nr:hypothetical protein O77CONTIG1_01200 [Leptolyngbya sp. O-77]